MTPRQFEISFQDRNGKYYYLDNVGDVKLSDTLVYIKDTPANWKDIQLKYGRGEKYMGIFRKSATPFEFQGDGAQILRYIYYANDGANFNAYCKMTLYKRNDGDTNIWSYDTYYDAEIDFFEGLDDGVNEYGTYIKVNLLERGLPEIIQDKLNTPYEIELGNDATDIKVTGLKLAGNYQYLASDLPSINVLDGAEKYVPPMGLAINEGEEYFGSTFFFQSQGYEKYTSVPTEINKFLYADKSLPVSYSLVLNLRATTNGSAGTTLAVSIIRKETNTTNLTATGLYLSSSFSGSNVPFNINVGGNFTFDPVNYTYYLVIVTTSVSGGSTTDIVIDNLKFSLAFTYQFPASIVKAKPYYKVAEELISKITGNTYPFVSGYLNFQPTKTDLAKYGNYNSAPGYTYLTSGDAIRGIQSSIKITLAELLQDSYAAWMTGFSTLNGVVQIQKLGYFMQDSSVIFMLDNVIGVKKSTATEFIYNQIRCGYPDPDVEQLNGKFEVNSEQTWKIPIQKGEELDLTTTFNAGIYDMEQIRLNLTEQDTTNDKRDNRVFIIEAMFNGSEYETIKYTYPTEGIINGVPDQDSFWNIGRSPKRNVLRHLPYLRSILNIADGTQQNPGAITFQEGLRNTFFNTFIGGYYLEEGADISPGANIDGTLQDKLFVPMIYEFEAQPPVNLISLIESNPYGVIGFNDNGTIRYGFVLDVGIKPATNDIYNIRLLASPI